MITRRQTIALLLLSGCGGAAEERADPAVPEPQAPAAPPPPLRDAHVRAVDVVGAKITAMVYVEDVRDHPLAERIAKLDAWGGVFEGTGIEPLRDVDRAFVAGRDLRDQQGVIAVAEHHVPPQTVQAALQSMVQRSGEDGAFLEHFPFPAARVKVRGRRSVVLAVKDDLLVVTSERYAGFVRGFDATGGLPDKEGGATMTLDANNPSETLDAPRVPPIPKTISHAHATVTFVSGGAAEVAVDAKSTDPKQAREDARALTEAVDDATSVKISVVKLRAFDPVAFRAEGDRVKAQRRVSRGELETLLGFAEMLAK